MYLFQEEGTHICMYDAENGTYNNEYNVCWMFSCSNTYFNAMYMTLCLPTWCTCTHTWCNFQECLSEDGKYNRNNFSLCIWWFWVRVGMTLGKLLFECVTASCVVPDDGCYCCGLHRYIPGSCALFPCLNKCLRFAVLVRLMSEKFIFCLSQFLSCLPLKQIESNTWFNIIPVAPCICT